LVGEVIFFQRNYLNYVDNFSTVYQASSLIENLISFKNQVFPGKRNYF
jgi:hypothetical protein